MKTIKGYNININEGILSSTKSGKSSTIEEFLKTMFYNERWYEKVQNETDTYNINYDFDFTKIDMVPFWIKECKSLKFDNCRFSEYVLPEKAEVLTFNNCQHLSKIKTNKKAATTTINELILQDCADIDFTELENITVKQVKIIDCEITTLKGLKGITSKLIIKNCKKLKTYDLDCPNIKNIVLYRTPIKSFVKPISAIDVSLINLRKVKNLEVLIGNVEDLRIEDCKELETLKIYANSTIYCVDGIEIPISHALTLDRVIPSCFARSAWVMPFCSRRYFTLSATIQSLLIGIVKSSV